MGGLSKPKHHSTEGWKEEGSSNKDWEGRMGEVRGSQECFRERKLSALLNSSDVSS